MIILMNINDLSCFIILRGRTNSCLFMCCEDLRVFKLIVKRGSFEEIRSITTKQKTLFTCA